MLLATRRHLLAASIPTPAARASTVSRQPSPSRVFLASRFKSTNPHLNSDRAGAPPQIVKPKPSIPHSATGDDQPSSTPLGEESTGAQPPPPSSPQSPPRLVRYERSEHEDHPSSHFHDYYHHSAPTSYALRARINAYTASSSSAVAAAAAKGSPSTSLFSFHPSATAISASTSAGGRSLAEKSSSVVSGSSAPGFVAAPQVGEGMMSEGVRNRKGQEANGSGANGDASAKTAAHAHSHGLFHSHSHAHSHAATEGSVEEADALLAALKGKGDRGSNITLVGLFSNVGLCAAKGLGGVYLNSAALLADAAHSLSDMFADLVTLFCWKMSQKPPSASHPLGYGKYETMGSLGVSLVLVAGAVGIGFHSYGLLLEALQPTLQNAPAALQALGHFTGSIAHAGSALHEHGGDKVSGADAGGLLDPNAMWFALISVVIKEWLYWATLRIAREENSSVLEANALHHRSDSLSSGVTFLAIGGSWLGFPVLDPLGGLLVAGLIGKQGADLLLSALAELSDRGVEPSVLKDFDAALESVQKTYPHLLVGWRELRAVKSGVSTFVDVTLEMPPETKLDQAREVEQAVRKSITGALKGVKEVRVHLDTVSART